MGRQSSLLVLKVTLTAQYPQTCDEIWLILHLIYYQFTVLVKFTGILKIQFEKDIFLLKSYQSG